MRASDDIQYFKSPGYLYGSDCVWEMNGLLGNAILLSFTELRMKTDVNCTSDYVELFEQMSKNKLIIAKLCTNEALNKTYRSSGSSMFLRYHSVASNGQNGFKASFKQGELELIFGHIGKSQHNCTNGGILQFLFLF